jgi:23S rRNA pseudouridine955/2504/2580 synthase
MREFEVHAGEGGRRLDRHLSKILGNAPMPLLQKLLRKKLIKLNGAKASGEAMISDGDKITVWVSDPFLAELVSAPKDPPRSLGAISAVYEDSDILVADKPPGLLTQASKPGGAEDTLDRRLIAYLSRNGQFSPGEGTAFTPACCNRLDRNTSGLVMCAKNLSASQELSKAFAEGKVEKIYLAALCGRIEKEQLLEGFIERNNETFSSMVSGEGKPAAMRVWPVAYGQGFTVARIQLLTGRTHQIRAFGKEMGHPVLGDPKYGDPSENARLARVHGIRAQLLHAEKMAYKRGEGKLKRLCELTWQAPPHGLFMRFLEKENAVPKL